MSKQPHHLRCKTSPPETSDCFTVSKDCFPRPCELAHSSPGEKSTEAAPSMPQPAGVLQRSLRRNVLWKHEHQKDSSLRRDLVAPAKCKEGRRKLAPIFLACKSHIVRILFLSVPVKLNWKSCHFSACCWQRSSHCKNLFGCPWGSTPWEPHGRPASSGLQGLRY